MVLLYKAGDWEEEKHPRGEGGKFEETTGGEKEGGERLTGHLSPVGSDEEAVSSIKEMMDSDYTETDASRVYDAVADYTGKGYTDVRTGATAVAQGEVKTLEEFIDASPKWDSAQGPLYRGLRNVDPKSFKIGQSVDMQGLSSWTSSTDVARSFSTHKSVIFQVDKASKAVPISHMSNFFAEKEVLMSAQPKFIVSGIRQINYRSYVKLVEVVEKSYFVRGLFCKIVKDVEEEPERKNKGQKTLHKKWELDSDLISLGDDEEKNHHIVVEQVEPWCSKNKCAYLYGIVWLDSTEESKVVACKGFPKGIPDIITYGDNGHSEPLSGQGNNIVYWTWMRDWNKGKK